jgi:hypothetical protein
MRSRPLVSEELRQGLGLFSWIEPAWLAADTCRMAKKPEPPKPTRWDVCKIAKKAVWFCTVTAPDKQTAIEKAVAEFKVDAWRLYAMERR